MHESCQSMRGQMAFKRWTLWAERLLADGGLGARELISEMKECSKDPAIAELVSVSQLKRFSKSIDDLDRHYYNYSKSL